MNATRPAVLLLLASCAAEPFLGPWAPVPEEPVTLGDLAAADVSLAAAYTRDLVARVERLPHPQRTAARDALRALQDRCAYNRAAVQLALVLQQRLGAVRVVSLPEPIQDEWLALRDGVDAHVALFDALGGDLARPEAGAYLADHLPPGLVHDRESLRSSADPVGDTQRLLDEVPTQFDRWDADTRDAVSGAIDALYPYLGPWPPKVPAKAWLRSLRTLAPQIPDAAVRAELAALVDALQSFQDQGC